MTDYQKENNIAPLIIHEQEIVHTPSPTVWPKECEEYIENKEGQYCFPAIFSTKISTAIVKGGNNLIINDNKIIHHNLYDLSHDYLQEEVFKEAVTSKDKKTIYYRQSPKLFGSIKKAFCFTDSCSFNYAHWLTEVLPRINLFQRTKEKDDILLLDEGLHANLLESTNLVSDDHHIIFLKPKISVIVEELTVISPAGYVPYWERLRHPIRRQGTFSPYALMELKKTLADKLPVPDKSKSSKVYIKRNSEYRNVSNHLEIEAALVSEGFTVIEPEKMTFAEQYYTFSTAETVIGATGAAMANLIFCKPTTKIFIMMSDSPEHIYMYWQNMACAVGCKINFIIGKSKNRSAAKMHDNFTIPTDLIKQAMASA